MRFYRHLMLDDLVLPAAAEWECHGPGWCFVRIANGAAYWLSARVNQELAEGGVAVVAPGAEGAIRASKLGEVRLQFFHFCPDLLGGFLTVTERHHLETFAARNLPPLQWLTPDHPIARQFLELTAQPPRSNGLFQRCETLFLAIAFFADELSRQKPPVTNSTLALHRFRRMVQQMPDQALAGHSIESLAEICGCSRRHFGRLFRQHFGTSFRARQVEMRLLKARQLLLESNAKVIEVALECGYRNLGLFNATFKKHVNMTPSQWRQKNLKKERKIRRAVAIILAGILSLGLSSRAADPPPAVPAPSPASTPTNAVAGPPATTATATATNLGPTFAVRGYEIVGNSLLTYEIFEPVLTNYLGDAVTFETIRKALSQLQMTYRERGFATVSVSLPPQQLTNGIVKVQITEGRLAAIDVINNNYYSSNNVMRALPGLRTNTFLNSLVLQQELDRANASRDRQIYPVVGPGPDPGTSSLLLKVKDRLPWHGRVELNNASTPNTPELRMNFASQYNNLWQLDHQVGVQYSMTPEAYKGANHYSFFEQPLIANYSTYYRLPLSGVNGPPRHHPYELRDFGYDEVNHRFRAPPATDVPELLFYASRSVSDTGSQLVSSSLNPPEVPITGGLQVSDKLFTQSVTVNENIGGRWLRPLPKVGVVESSISVGPDFKRYRSPSTQDRIFQGIFYVPEVDINGKTNLVGQPSPPVKTSRNTFTAVDYLPFSVNWEGSIGDKTGTTFFNINNTFHWAGLFGNGGDFRNATGLPDLRAPIYQGTNVVGTNTIRRVTGTYYVGNFGLTREQKLPGDWGIRLHADGQIATEPLITNEQFGSGGSAGVRGYRDGQVYSDTGWRVQFEPHSPNWNVGLVDGKAPMYLRAYAFMDYGQGYLLEPGDRKGTISLWGTGFGCNGSIGERIDFRLSIGFPLLNVPGVRTASPRVTFAIGGQF